MKEFDNEKDAMAYIEKNKNKLLQTSEDSYCPLTGNNCQSNCVCYTKPYAVEKNNKYEVVVGYCSNYMFYGGSR